MVTSLMVVGDFYFMGADATPFEANSELIVYSYTVLGLSISRQALKAITRRHSQLFYALNRIQLIELSCRNLPNSFWTRFPGCTGVFAIKNIFSGLVFK